MKAVRALMRAALGGATIARRLPPEVGAASIFVAPSSQLRFLAPGRRAWHDSLIEWAQTYVRPGHMVWDVGANCGVFSFAAAGMGARVLAIEPDPFLCNNLIRSKRANPSLAVDVLGAAISDAPGIAALSFSREGRASNSVRPINGAATDLLVPTMRLDDLMALEKPDIVKIDVEGGEIRVFAGAWGLLKAARPMIFAEVMRANRDKILPGLLSLDYDIFDAEHGGPFSEETTRDILAVPRA